MGGWRLGLGWVHDVLPNANGKRLHQHVVKWGEKKKRKKEPRLRHRIGIRDVERYHRAAGIAFLRWSWGG